MAELNLEISIIIVLSYFCYRINILIRLFPHGQRWNWQWNHPYFFPKTYYIGAPANFFPNSMHSLLDHCRKILFGCRIQSKINIYNDCDTIYSAPRYRRHNVLFFQLCQSRWQVKDDSEYQKCMLLRRSSFLFVSSLSPIYRCLGSGYPSISFYSIEKKLAYHKFDG